MLKKVLKVLTVIISGLIIGFFVYLNIGHYDATSEAQAYVATEENDDYITYDSGSTTGFIFYPGAKVESEAYSYLSQVDANVYIAKFPFELAMLDYKVAGEIIEENPQVTTWYIGGHSLGGVFANRYAVNNQEKFEGVVYLGSYPADGDQSDMPGLALFGDQDLVVGDPAEKTSLFTNADQIVTLENANHSGFGNYGQQKGDSELTDTDRETQQETIIKDIDEFIK